MLLRLTAKQGDVEFDVRVPSVRSFSAWLIGAVRPSVGVLTTRISRSVVTLLCCIGVVGPRGGQL